MGVNSRRRLCGKVQDVELGKRIGASNPSRSRSISAPASLEMYHWYSFHLGQACSFVEHTRVEAFRE